ncbi:MAG: hypothetical protein J0I98_11555 [Mesorhizobium sp.]|nr:hypothetical protein [Mesorhizobium sp.]MBN9243420.1 hypothetical protein [Mesorhizobium sp.]
METILEGGGSDTEWKLEMLVRRVVILEELVDVLMGKALADSGAMSLRLEEIEADNAEIPERHVGNPVNEALHRDLNERFRERKSRALRESLSFPKRWQRARRPKHAGDRDL